MCPVEKAQSQNNNANDTKRTDLLQRSAFRGSFIQRKNDAVGAILILWF